MAKSAQPGLRFEGGVDKKPPPPKIRKPKKPRTFAAHGFSPALVEMITEYASKHMAEEIKGGYYFFANLEKWGFTEREVHAYLEAYLTRPYPYKRGLVQLLSDMIATKQQPGGDDMDELVR